MDGKFSLVNVQKDNYLVAVTFVDKLRAMTGELIILILMQV